MTEGAEFIGHEPCAECGSSDAGSRYSDGHYYCFACGHYAAGETTETAPKKRPKAGLLPIGEARPLPARGLSLETCRKWGYTVGVLEGEAVHIANFRDPSTHELIAQKVRTRNKDFKFLGDTKRAGLYGRHLWRAGGRKVIITEGEIDALSVSQVQDNKWPVVSIPNGTNAARKVLAQELDWLLQFQEIVLCFDMDEPGREAVADCVTLFPPGRVYVVSLPMKDANEMLVAGRVKELVQCLWDARVYRPDGILTVADIQEEVLQPPEMGLPWCLPSISMATFGRRYGECVALGAGTGVGKTTLVTQQIAADIQAGNKVAIFAFEQAPRETVKRIAGQIAGRRFHVPDGTWAQDELEGVVAHLSALNSLYLYDHFGACDWEIVKERVRYLRHAHDVRLFYIDHLTALAAAADDERKALEKIMSEVSSLTKELNIWILFVSHLTTPEGKPHEEGGRVMIRHFKGSRAIGYWAHFMLGLERAQQADDEDERKLTTLRILKDRYTGESTGLTQELSFDSATGRLFEGSVENSPEAPF